MIHQTQKSRPRVAGMSRKSFINMIILLALLFPVTAQAAEAQKAKTISSLEAYEMIQQGEKNTFLVDVRCRWEYFLMGHPPQALQHPLASGHHGFSGQGRALSAHQGPPHRLSIERAAQPGLRGGGQLAVQAGRPFGGDLHRRQAGSRGGRRPGGRGLQEGLPHRTRLFWAIPWNPRNMASWPRCSPPALAKGAR